MFLVVKPEGNPACQFQKFHIPWTGWNYSNIRRASSST